jgi:ATP-binding cassette subfamily F protein 3
VVRKELLMSQYKNQQQQLKQTQEFIERFRYKATKARQVQSRIKQMEKIDLIEIDTEENEIHFEFPQPQQGGRVAMELKSLNKSYGDHVIFSDLDYKVERGERIAVVGVNGAGKSTLSRIIAGVEAFDAGERTVGYNTTLSYFAQNQADELDMTKDVLSVVEEDAATETRVRLRTLLGSFLFHGDDVFKRVSVLSGGERSRLALAKMLLQPANFLVMDEPTNHLDMKSKRVLQEALSNYEGTFMIVSHDRAFLDPIVTRVLEVTPGKIKIYLGNVSEYLAKKKAERESPKQVAAAVKPEEKKKNWQEEQEKKKILAKEIRGIKKKIEQTETEIQKFEARKKEIEALLADSKFYKRGAEASDVTEEYGMIKKKIEGTYWNWSKLTEKLEQAEKKG